VTSLAAALQTKARALKRLALTVYFAARDPRTPLPVRMLAVCVAAYAFSPIDLIPDFIPVLGYLDDAILLPLGILLVVRMIPPDIMAEHRAAAQIAQARPQSLAGALAIIAIWIALSAGAGWLTYRWLYP